MLHHCLSTRLNTSELSFTYMHQVKPNIHTSYTCIRTVHAVQNTHPPKVGPGVKGALVEGDLVQPAAPFAGAWRAALVAPAKSLTKVGSLAHDEPAWRAAVAGGGAAAAACCREAAEAAAAAAGGAQADGRPQAALLPLEYMAVSREMVAAYRLLEMGDLQVMLWAVVFASCKYCPSSGCQSHLSS